MATAKKLPSGKWRAQAYDYTDETGKIHRRSFTADTKKAAELMAAQFACSKDRARTEDTFRECADRYIRQRTAILSASTIREYSGYADRYMKEFADIRLNRITQEDIQALVNRLSLALSPKTVRNVHGFITAILAAYRPDFAVHTALPKKVPPKVYVPTEAEIKRLMAQVKDTPMELPVLLAAFGPMRRGEICALRSDNINGTIVHVCENMVLDKENKWVIKTPKSYAGDRYIDYPVFVAEKWAGKAGRIVELDPDDISHRFEHVLKQAGLSHFRFHDLRHYSASIQHAMGIPDAYIMQRGGWKGDGVLKQVYRHALPDQQKEMTAKINSYFQRLSDEA